LARNTARRNPIAWVMGSTESSTRTYRDGMQVGTTEIAYIQTEAGVRCCLHTGDEVPVSGDFVGMCFRMVGTHGFIEWGTGGPLHNSYRILNAASPEGEIVTPDYKQGKLAYLTRLAAEIRAGTPDYTNIDASQLALQMVCATYLSSRSQQKVRFPWDQAQVDALVPDAPFWPGVPYNGSGGGRDGKTWRQA
jgi:hypothetical protein